MEQGCTALRKAFDMAREDHIILLFAEYAPAVIDMVRHMAHADSRDAYLKEVLSACGQYMESLKHSARSTVSLSTRELEILTLAAEGLKRDEIAKKLYVAAGTVQTHLHNVYRKLEVSGRTAAVKKAQKLKLLSFSVENIPFGRYRNQKSSSILLSMEDSLFPRMTKKASCPCA